jgi:PAS domain S-box-containing protein
VIEPVVSPGTAAALIGSSDDAIVGLTLDGIVTSWNPGAERMYGFSAAEMLGYRIHRLVPLELREAEARRIERAAGGTEIRTLDAPRLCRDGNRVIVSSSCFPVRDDRYRITAVGLIERDVTRERAMEAQLLQAKRMEAVARLAGAVAQEFNNISTAILGLAKLVSERTTDTAVRTDADAIMQQAMRASRITHHLLAFSDRVPRMPGSTAINDTLRSMEPLLQRLVGERVWLVLALGSGNPLVRATINDLELLIFELILSVCDVIGGRGTIALSTRETIVDEDVLPAPAGVPSGRFIKIEVRATPGRERGAGAMRPLGAPNTAEFDFYRMATIAGAAQRVAAHVVTSNSSVDSADDHVVSIFVPAGALEDVAPAKAAEPLEAADETILLVDDDDAVREVVSRVLSAQGYNVLQARDGEDALNVAGAHGAAIDLVVSDVVMPRMDGRGLSDRLRKRYPQIRFLFVSGYTRGAVGADQLCGPVTDFLAKPFTMDSLCQAMRALLGRRQVDEGTNALGPP